MDEARLEGVDVKARAWWPAIVGLVLLLGVYLLVLVRGTNDDAATAPAEPVTTAQKPATQPAVKPPEPVKPEATHDEATDEDELARTKPIDTSPVAPDPGMTAKKAKMTLDERLAEAQKHIPVIERRAELLDKEIAELDKAGKVKEAGEQRIVAKRLRDHAAALRQAIAERREPM